MVSGGVSINRNGVVTITFLVICAVILFYLYFRAPGHENFGANALFEVQEVDVTKLPELPPATEEELSAFTAERVTIPVEVKGKKVGIYSLQTTPTSEARLTVLLLHGLGDSSHNWVQVNTLHLLAHWGYRAVAIDLPGYGHSQDVALGDLPHEEFMVALVKALGPSLPVIVAPSMAGSFAIPYLFQTPQLGVERASGFIAVSPTTSETQVQNYPESQLRTLILYGVADTRLGAFSRKHLETLPRCNIIQLPNAGHACFKEQPALFHRAVFHYLHYLES